MNDLFGTVLKCKIDYTYCYGRLLTVIKIINSALMIISLQAGIQSLITGISLPLPRDDTCPQLSRAHVLRDKMRNNLNTAQERLTFLRTTLHLNNLRWVEIILASLT